MYIPGKGNMSGINTTIMLAEGQSSLIFPKGHATIENVEIFLSGGELVG